MATRDSADKSPEFVPIRQLRDLPEALIIKTFLESAGIECRLGDENVVRLDWFWSNAIGGVKLWVQREDAEAAINLLDQNTIEGFPVDGVGEYKQPHCPRCQSVDISLNALNKPVAYTTAYLGLPIPLKRRGWKCHACGNEWPELEIHS